MDERLIKGTKKIKRNLIIINVSFLLLLIGFYIYVLIITFDTKNLFYAFLVSFGVIILFTSYISITSSVFNIINMKYEINREYENSLDLANKLYKFPFMKQNAKIFQVEAYFFLGEYSKVDELLFDLNSGKTKYNLFFINSLMCIRKDDLNKAKEWYLEGIKRFGNVKKNNFFLLAQLESLKYFFLKVENNEDYLEGKEYVDLLNYPIIEEYIASLNGETRNIEVRIDYLAVDNLKNRRFIFLQVLSFLAPIIAVILVFFFYFMKIETDITTDVFEAFRICFFFALPGLLLLILTYYYRKKNEVKKVVFKTVNGVFSLTLCILLGLESFALASDHDYSLVKEIEEKTTFVFPKEGKIKFDRINSEESEDGLYYVVDQAYVQLEGEYNEEFFLSNEDKLFDFDYSMDFDIWPPTSLVFNIKDIENIDYYSIYLMDTKKIVTYDYLYAYKEPFSVITYIVSKGFINYASYLCL